MQYGKKSMYLSFTELIMRIIILFNISLETVLKSLLKPQPSLFRLHDKRLCVDDMPQIILVGDNEKQDVQKTYYLIFKEDS